MQLSGLTAKTRRVEQRLRSKWCSSVAIVLQQVINECNNMQRVVTLKLTGYLSLSVGSMLSEHCRLAQAKGRTVGSHSGPSDHGSRV